MPPRIRAVATLPSRYVVSHSHRSVAPFLAPALEAQSSAQPQIAFGARFASILSALHANPGEHHKAIRRGRGPSSGKGKTSGRGHKGQKQHGKVPANFEGGQTPIHVVKGSRGFINVHSEDYNTVPLSRIFSWIAQGRIDPSKPITVRELSLSGCVNNIQDGVKLLANSKSHDLSTDEVPQINQPFTIVVSRASKQAIEAVEKAGGTVLTRYYTKWAIKKIIEGKMDPIVSLQSVAPSEGVSSEQQGEAEGGTTTSPLSLTPSGAPTYRLPDATSRKAIEYYRDPAHRGYLSYQVKEGQNPSLFFRDVAHESNFGKHSKASKSIRAKKTQQHSQLF